jgi:hypothetical protein
LNIFRLSDCPAEAAAAHFDAHVVKMPLETAQILSTAVFNASGRVIGYKPTHHKHPSTIWAGESRANFLWLTKLGKELCNEYNHRYDKVHKCLAAIELAEQYAEEIPDLPETPQKLAMPELLRLSHPVDSYRNYYLYGKIGVTKRVYYTRRRPPSWIEQHPNFAFVKVLNDNK